MVKDALNPMLSMVADTLFSTPDPASTPALMSLWTQSWQLLLAFYGLIVMIAGIVLMAWETVQTRLTVQQVAPRLAAGFLAGTLSMFVATKAVQLANALSAGVMGEGLDPQATAKALSGLVLGVLSFGNLWGVMIASAMVILLVILLVTYAVRVLVTFALIAVAPIALMWHALPHTDGIAQTWWKAFAGALAIQVAQSLTLIVALRVFFAPGGFNLLGPTPSGWLNVFFCLALLWVLMKIPFWCLSPLRSGSGRSLVSRVVRGVIAYKTMGLAHGIGAGLSGGGSSHGGGGGHGGGGSGGGLPRPRRPVGGGGGGAGFPATRSGQLMLPLGVRRTRSPGRRTAQLGLPGEDGSAAASRRPGPGQLSLFTARNGDGNGAGTGGVELRANPRALPREPLPGNEPGDQLGLPITALRDPGRAPRRTLADELADRDLDRDVAPRQTAQRGLVTPDGRVNRNARPPAQLRHALITPQAGMLPLTLRPAPDRPHPPATQQPSTAAATPQPRPQTGPGLITPAGHVNPAARPPRARSRDPYGGNRALASGQYPLPLGVRRQRATTPNPAQHPAPKPAPAPKPPRQRSASGARRAGTQLPLPLDLPRKTRGAGPRGGGASRT